MNYYQVLGVTPDASHEDIKAAYRALASKWHPDKHGCSAEATAMMQKINMAYATLSDVSKRSQYDFTNGLGNFKGRGGVHGEAARRTHAHNAKKKEAESKKKADEAMARARKKAEEATKRAAKKTSRKKSSQTSGQSQEAPKEAPKSSEPPKADRSSARAFNPNKPCVVCWGSGGVRIAQGFQTAKVICPQCEGVGS